MKKNDELQVYIEGYSSDGFGVAKPDGFVLFIPAAIVGETVLVHVTRVNKNFGYAFVKDIITPSPLRTEPLCPVSKKCGGCELWHMTYAEEKRFKYEKVLANLKKAGIETPLLPIIGAPSLTAYRNKAQYPVREQNGEICVGFYRSASHTVIESPCAIQPDIFERIAGAVKTLMLELDIPAYNEQTLGGTVRHIYLRRGEGVMLCLVVKGKLPHKKALVDKLTVQFKEITTICINYNDKNTNVILSDRYEVLYGDGYVTDTLLSKKFKISPAAFYQVNRDGCELLYQKVRELAQVTERDRVLDLYCGIGTIGLCVADKARELVGVEIVEAAVRDARENAKINGITGAGFYADDAGNIAKIAKGDFDVIIVDPPRKGCDIKTLEFLIEKKPPRLVYVSCDSATLARDLKILISNGFEIESITPVDMFPRTKHVECAVKLCFTAAI